MAGETVPASPTLEVLQRRVEAGHAEALAEFWREVAAKGAPLIEPIPGDDENMLVTFVFRAERDAGAVAVVSALPGRDSTEVMTRMPGTDLWHKSYRAPNDTRESYQFAVGDRHVIDPLNPRTHVFPDDPENGFTGWTSSVLALPAAPAQTWSEPRPHVPAGQVAFHRAPSALLGDEYRVWVYTPPGFSPDGSPCGLLLALDGWFYLNLIPTPTILDNLTAEGRLPPLVALLVGDVFGKNRQRDLACHPPFADFLTSELLPWARQHWRLADDPAQNCIAGASLGGLMAAFVGLRHSHIFGSVLCQSAYFGWRRAGDREDEWIIRQYAAGPRLPLRFYLEAGKFETHVQTIEPGWNNFLGAARHMRNVLQAKGYEAAYSEFSGGHNPMNWRGTLANGLLALLGKGAGGSAGAA